MDVCVPRKPIEPGTRFGKWTVLSQAQCARAGLSLNVRCECGYERVIHSGQLRSGKSRQCRTCSNTHHGGSVTGKEWPEYNIWRSMLGRCQNPRDKSYSRYGGRGICVCARWLTFAHFIQDMGRRPDARLSLDRIDNDGHYEPGNCRWATDIQQARNTRASKRITIAGETLSLAEWCDRYRIPYGPVTQRINKLRWDPLRALSTPVRLVPKRKG